MIKDLPSSSSISSHLALWRKKSYASFLKRWRMETITKIWRNKRVKNASFSGGRIGRWINELKSFGKLKLGHFYQNTCLRMGKEKISSKL